MVIILSPFEFPLNRGARLGTLGRGRLSWSAAVRCGKRSIVDSMCTLGRLLRGAGVVRIAGVVVCGLRLSSYDLVSRACLEKKKKFPFRLDLN